MDGPSPSPIALGAVPPAPRWLALAGNRLLVGRLIVGILAGVVVGIAVSIALARDRREGAALTKEKYVAGFEAHKQELQDSSGSTPAYVLVSALTVLAIAGLYEVGGKIVAPAVGWLDETLARRNAGRRRGVLDDTDV